MIEFVRLYLTDTRVFVPVTFAAIIIGLPFVIAWWSGRN